MGNTTSNSCVGGKGSLLLVACANGDQQVANEILKQNPRAALYHNFKDRSSPLLQAAARGHFELVQLLLESAVMSEGPERAKRHCIDHANAKRQTALMVACKHGHPDCVEYLVTNGSDPLLTDERRHNTCLHFAALYGHSECVHKLLSCRTTSRGQGPQVPVARINCVDDADGSHVAFVDGHNGWGLTALHIAVFQGSVTTVKALLRHGASLEVVIAPPRVENSPIRCAAGSNALHIAALIGNVSMAKLVLEAQENFPGLELRSQADAAGMRPQEYAQRARNSVLVHLLDDRLPVHLLRQIWLNFSLDAGLPARHQTLGSLLQKLKLMFNLEIIAIQRHLSLMDSILVGTAPERPAAAEQQQQQQEQEQPGKGGGSEGLARDGSRRGVLWEQQEPRRKAQGGGGQQGAARQQWASQLADVQELQSMVQKLHVGLQRVCSHEPSAAAAAEGPGSAWPPPSPPHEDILDFILSTLITPRTVSAVLHAAKKLVCASVMHPPAQLEGGLGGLGGVGWGAGLAVEPPLNDAETQHSLALLRTALGAVETCLRASAQLAAPAEKAGRAQDGAAGRTSQEAATPTASTAAPPTAQAEVAAGTPGDTSAGESVGSATEGGAAGVGGKGQGQEGGGALQVLLPPHLDTIPAASLQQQPETPGAAGAGGAVPQADTDPAHWSSHLHTLIAQLQWDIGVQRHRRRRAHAAASAARATSAAMAASAAAAVAAAAQEHSSMGSLHEVAVARAVAARRAGELVGSATGAASSQSSRSSSSSSSSRHGQRPGLQSQAPGLHVGQQQQQQQPASAPAGAAASAAACTPQPPLRCVAPAAGVGSNPGAGHEGSAKGGRRGQGSGPFGPNGLGPLGSGTLGGPLEVNLLGSSPPSGPLPLSPGSPLIPGFPRGALPEGDSGIDLHGSEGEDDEDEEEDGSSLCCSEDEEGGMCPICMDTPVSVVVASCLHGLCVQCAFQLTVKGRELPSCPFCRSPISGFEFKAAESSEGSVLPPKAVPKPPKL